MSIPITDLGWNVIPTSDWAERRVWVPGHHQLLEPKMYKFLSDYDSDLIWDAYAGGGPEDFLYIVEMRKCQ
jgi:hypothetical protein